MASTSVIAKQANIKHEELKSLLEQIAEQYEFKDELEHLKNVRRVPKHPELTRLWETQAIIEILKKFLPTEPVVESEPELNLDSEVDVESDVQEEENQKEDEVIESTEQVDEKPKRKRG